MDATALSAATATDLPYLTGRTVTDGMNTGVVTAAEQDVCTVRWADAGFAERCATLELTAVNPDRPTIARDELFAGTLGEILAERAGVAALAGFHRGHNDGRIAFTEAAREVLRRLDQRATQAKHTGCGYSYVVDAEGIRRTGRARFDDGDRLITCTFHVDGPNTFYCGPHRADVDAGRPGSIYRPTPDGADVPADCRTIVGEALSPFEQPKALVAVAA